MSWQELNEVTVQLAVDYSVNILIVNWFCFRGWFQGQIKTIMSGSIWGFRKKGFYECLKLCLTSLIGFFFSLFLCDFINPLALKSQSDLIVIPLFFPPFLNGALYERRLLLVYLLQYFTYKISWNVLPSFTDWRKKRFIYVKKNVFMEKLQHKTLETVNCISQYCLSC